jgi:peptidyl-prolyl cis-trans isomerase C
MMGFASLPAAADDVVVARVNGNDIKQSDLDFAATEVGSRLASYTPADRRKILLQYVIENELMAEAGQKDSLDKAATFPDRVKYHERRALRDAFFDAGIANAVTEDAAKKIYDEKIGQMKPEQEIHARHILVETEAEAKEIEERLKKGEDFATSPRRNRRTRTPKAAISASSPAAPC